MEFNLNSVLYNPTVGSGPQPTPTQTSPNDSDPAHSSTTNDASKDSSPRDVGNLTPSEPRQNPRSCVTCRRRKIRCNKLQPCSNCTKAKVECVFPKPGRAPRKSKKATEADLLARLKTLESIVRNIGKSTAEEASSTEAKKDANVNSELGVDIFTSRSPKDIELDSVDEEMGRLVINDDKSRYVSHRFWTRFGDEIEELKDMIDCPTSEEEDDPSSGDSKSGSSQWTRHDGFIFGFWSVTHSLRGFHLPPERFDIMWETYLENVAPVVPIFHRPTLKTMLRNAVSNLDSVNKNTEALLLTVYYTTIASMTPEQCLSQLGEDRDAALNRFRFAVEQALARANLLSTRSLVLLQSLVLFLICVRQSGDPRYILSLASLAIQIGRAIGLHRDGTAFGLTPFETEIRRRLWLQICLADFCSAEDHGCDPVIHEASYDTLPPLNINDEDISPDSKEFPKERVGCTDMTFLLFRGDINMLARRLTHVPPSNTCKKFIASFSQKEREEMVENLSKRLEEKYVRHCDVSIPIQWVCGALSRLVVASLLLMIHHPMTRDDAEGSVPAVETENRLFLSAIEIIEFSLLLETNSNTSKWSWFFRAHTQWHAIAYVLSNLCVRRACPVVERAWRAVNAAYKMSEMKGQQKGMLWPGIRKLMARALRYREMQLQQLTAQYGTGEPCCNGLQPPNDSVVSQTLTPGTYMSQQPHPPSTSAALPMETEPSSNMNAESYDIGSIDASGLSWPSLPQDNLYGADISSINHSIASPPPSWDEWNRVVREFQLDIRNDDLATLGQDMLDCILLQNFRDLKILRTFPENCVESVFASQVLCRSGQG
ncbi:hypothetical protein D8B26_003937 [Coccidioides posadasii str. Silveira]|uniref:uncharacterized protein n=1 Tax=Coccidioides posadasii (strain RMSCC 757 / Silveira) TaxID=443226 RepID=UPI001BF0887F|nr:hypothetical protein D8B26_003937 [Coccidioides posadasii str. Silveira]